MFPNLVEWTVFQYSQILFIYIVTAMPITLDIQWIPITLDIQWTPTTQDIQWTPITQDI